MADASTRVPGGSNLVSTFAVFRSRDWGNLSIGFAIRCAVRKRGVMSVRAMQVERQRDLVAHIKESGGLPTSEIEGIKQLATQLHGERVLPVVGAGASFDCGMCLASEIAEDLFTSYIANSDFAPHLAHLAKTDLGSIAEAIYLRTDQSRVVSELGLPDRAIWRPATQMGSHFCVYSVLARMVREKFVEEAFGFNYDCGAEAAFQAEGFAYGNVSPGKHWIDRARTVADGATNASTKKDSSSFTLYKANGCAERFRELAIQDVQKAAEEIIVRTDQIDRWKDSAWSEPPFISRAQNHVLMLIGFAAQDPKISVALKQALEAIHQAAPTNGQPRVVAVDHSPNTAPIESLIDSGLGGVQPPAGVATRICTQGATSTAALVVLLCELLEIELGQELAKAAVPLPVDLEARLALFAVSAPAMHRWSYLMEDRDGNLIQRANVLANGGYVPLGNNPELAARQILARKQLREGLGLLDDETPTEAAAHGGFIPHPLGGRAYMPLGVEHGVLTALFRPGAEHERLKGTLRGQYPSGIECVLVSGDGSQRRGVSLSSGREVDESSGTAVDDG
jgi:SIR2-like domain